MLFTCNLPACVLCGHGWCLQWFCGPEPGIQAMKTVKGRNEHVPLASPLCPAHSLISPRNTPLQYHLPSGDPSSCHYCTGVSFLLQSAGLRYPPGVSVNNTATTHGNSNIQCPFPAILKQWEQRR